MKHYVGIDLHSTNSYVAIINEKGDLKFKRKMPNNINTILKTLEVFKQYITGIVVESTFNWYWLVDALKESGYTVHLSNPAATYQYKGLKYSDDKTDAIWLAEMLRLKILPIGYIYPRKKRAIRDLLRKRTILLKHRTALLLNLKGTLNNWVNERISRKNITKICNSEITNMLNDNNNIIANTSINNVIKNINEQIKVIEMTVHKEIKLKSEYKLLLTVWGIGPLLAKTIFLETGDISRFPNVGNYSSYCRCVSSKRISNEKQKGSGNKKNGNRYLAWAYIEAAHYMKRYYKEAQTWFDKKASKNGMIVATKALSNKISRACYFVIKDQVPFEPKKLFG